MSSINMGSILAKAKKCMATSEKQTEVRRIKDGVMTGVIGRAKFKTSNGTSIHGVDEAATKFIDVLKSEIGSSGLSPDAIASISNIDHGVPTSLNDGTYIIDVYFCDDLSRPSLDPAKYGSINNIAALLNKGVDHTMHPVHGEWHGHETWSRTVIPGVHFIESAVSSFMGNYAADYNVIDISVDGVYM